MRRDPALGHRSRVRDEIHLQQAERAKSSRRFIGEFVSAVVATPGSSIFKNIHTYIFRIGTNLLPILGQFVGISKSENREHFLVTLILTGKLGFLSSLLHRALYLNVLHGGQNFGKAHLAS